MNQQIIDDLASTYSDRVRNVLMDGSKLCIHQESIAKLSASTISDCISIMLASGMSEALVRLIMKVALDNAAKTIDSLAVEMAEH